MGFLSDIKKSNARVKKALDEGLREVVSEAADLLIHQTPRDTGFARSNWDLQKGPTPVGEVPEKKRPEPGETYDQSGDATAARLREKAEEFEFGDDVSIVNDVYYTRYLNQGSSPQAPGIIEPVAGEMEGLAEKIMEKHLD